MNNKKVIYTALFGDYDNLQEPAERFKGWDFICFTDNKDLNSNIWKIIRVCPELPPQLENRKYKILPHIYLKNYDISLYIDSNIKIKRNPIDLVNKYLANSLIAMPKHFKNNCIYKEAKDIIKNGKERKDIVLKQIKFYKDQGFPENFGLAENGIILRKHNAKPVIKLMECWWEQINKFAKRDQLSFMYCVWKNKIDVKFMEESARGSKYFRIYPHKKNYKYKLIGKCIDIVRYIYLNYIIKL